MRSKLLVTTFLAVGLAAPAFAAGAPCLEDIQRLCGDVEPGDGQVQACIESKKDQASPACRMNIVKMKAELKRGERACGDDAMRLCGDVEPGQGRVAKCLTENESSLTPACQAWIGETRDKLEDAGDKLRDAVDHAKAVNDACAAEIQLHCADVTPGKGRRLECLKANAASASDACKAALQ